MHTAANDMMLKTKSKSELQNYFDKLLVNIRDVKIKSIFIAKDMY